VLVVKVSDMGIKCLYGACSALCGDWELGGRLWYDHGVGFLMGLG